MRKLTSKRGNLWSFSRQVRAGARPHLIKWIRGSIGQLRPAKTGYAMLTSQRVIVVAKHLFTSNLTSLRTALPVSLLRADLGAPSSSKLVLFWVTTDECTPRRKCLGKCSWHRSARWTRFESPWRNQLLVMNNVLGRNACPRSKSLRTCFLLHALVYQHQRSLPILTSPQKILSLKYFAWRYSNSFPRSTSSRSDVWLRKVAFDSRLRLVRTNATLRIGIRGFYLACFTWEALLVSIVFLSFHFFVPACFCPGFSFAFHSHIVSSHLFLFRSQHLPASATASTASLLPSSISSITLVSWLPFPTCIWMRRSRRMSFFPNSGPCPGRTFESLQTFSSIRPAFCQKISVAATGWTFPGWKPASAQAVFGG